MGAIVVTVNTVEPAGKRTRSTGTLHLASSYATGGDTCDPMEFGLATVEDLFLGFPRAANGAAVSAVVTPVVRSVLPQRTTKFGGSGAILIQLFTAESTEASGDVSALIIPFEAYGY